MLQELSVKNFAIIDQLTMVLGSGLNVLTGETGAGKSIIVDAVSLLLGGRASSEMIRDGQERAVLEGVFECPRSDSFKALSEELGIELDEGDPLILSREISRSGKNVCRINGRVTTLSSFREIGQTLVDLHGQQEQQALFNKDRQQQLLDSFAGAAAVSLRAEAAQFYHQLTSVRKQIAALKQDEKEHNRKLDLLSYQAQEIETARLNQGEDGELELLRIRLLNAEKLAAGAENIYQCLYEAAGGQRSAYDQLGRALTELRPITALDPKLQPLTEDLENARLLIEEASRLIKRYQEDLEHDPQTLQQTEERLAQLRQLKRKYGESVGEILDYYERIKTEIRQMGDLDTRREDLEKQEQRLAAGYLAKAGELGAMRKDAALKLEQELMEEFAYLQMPGADFRVSLHPREQLSAAGLEEVEFLISANPGESLKPLAKIASGGETSRIMLALKSILARVDQVPTLIFDEIDTGIGGRSLEAVANRLLQVAQDRQVICVTHAPQIASKADSHFLIQKTQQLGRNITNIEEITGQQQIEEISRMLAGDSITLVTLQHAAEMLNRRRR